MTTELTLCFKLRFVAAAADAAAAAADEAEVVPFPVPFSRFGLEAGSWTVLEGGLDWGGGTKVDEVLKIKLIS